MYVYYSWSSNLKVGSTMTSFSQQFKSFNQLFNDLIFFRQMSFKNQINHSILK